MSAKCSQDAQATCHPSSLFAEGFLNMSFYQKKAF